MNTSLIVTRKMNEAVTTAADDPSRLWEIVRELNDISAWEEARQVMRLAEAAEERLEGME